MYPLDTCNYIDFLFKNKGKVEDNVSEGNAIGRGVRQGSPLFNRYPQEAFKRFFETRRRVKMSCEKKKKSNALDFQMT